MIVLSSYFVSFAATSSSKWVRQVSWCCKVKANRLIIEIGSNSNKDNNNDGNNRNNNSYDDNNSNHDDNSNRWLQKRVRNEISG